MIRIDALWLATKPLDMRAGPDKALGRVVEVFGAARLHHAYLFANQRGTRMKVLVHDGQGLWLLARRLHQGRFVWPHGDQAAHIELNQAQWQALVMGLPWQRLQADGAIRVV
jgi:transposase